MSKNNWRTGDLEAKIRLTYERAQEAKAVAGAVSPDNVKLPSGLIVETTRRGSSVLAIVNCRKGLSTFIATLDDLLSCISVAERAFSVAKEG